MPTPGPLTSAWSDLQRLSAGRSSFNLREAFAEDRQRGERFICHAAGLDLDLSRQLLDSELLHSLCKLADQVGLRTAIDSMWAGDPVNTTERRAAWHVMLRHPGGPKSPKIVESVLAERERMLEFAELIRRSGVVIERQTQPHPVHAIHGIESLLDHRHQIAALLGIGSPKINLKLLIELRVGKKPSIS